MKSYPLRYGKGKSSRCSSKPVARDDRVTAQEVDGYQALAPGDLDLVKSDPILLGPDKNGVARRNHGPRWRAYSLPQLRPMNL